MNFLIAPGGVVVFSGAKMEKGTPCQPRTLHGKDGQLLYEEEWRGDFCRRKVDVIDSVGVEHIDHYVLNPTRHNFLNKFLLQFGKFEELEWDSITNDIGPDYNIYIYKKLR